MAMDKISDHYVTVNGITLHYVRHGAGAPLMLIHGWPSFWYEWHHNIGPLAEHFDVIVPDMRGFAYSDKPDVAPEARYTDVHHAEDIKAFPSTAPSAWSPTCWPSATVRFEQSRRPRRRARACVSTTPPAARWPAEPGRGLVADGG